MKKVVTALGNEVLNEELKRYSKYNVLTEDIYYQDGVLDFISNNEVDVIIISSILQGQFNIVEFVDEIKNRAFGSRIIIIADSINQGDINLLISKGVFDILNDQEIDIPDVIEAIDREDPINIKAQIEKQANSIKEAIENSKTPIDNVTTILSAVQKQEVIGIFGTSGSGKSTISANLVKSFAKKTKAKILLIDFDTLNGNLNEILDVNKIPENVELIMDEDKKCGLNYAADLSIKNRLDTNVLDEIVINCNGFDFLSGNTSLHYCQNVLNEDFYDYLIKCAKEKYDFIFLDISSNIYLDSTKWALKECTNLLFVTENTGICLKKTIQLLDVAFNTWNVYKGKVKLVLNRVSNYGIDEDVFAQITNLKVIGCIKEHAEELNDSYDKILETLDYIPKNGIIKKITQNAKLITNLLVATKA